MAETGQAQPLLQVRAPVDPQAQAGAAPREEHLIPYVPQIVPGYDPAAGGRSSSCATLRLPACLRGAAARQGRQSLR